MNDITMTGADESLLLQKSQQDTQCVLYDAYDERLFNAAVRDLHSFRLNTEELIAELATAPQLIKDLYWAFYKSVPLLNQDVSTPYRFNLRIMKEVLGTTQWQSLRVSTTGDPIGSAIATMTVLPQLIKDLDANLKAEVQHLQQTEQQLKKLLNAHKLYLHLAELHPDHDENYKQQAQEKNEEAQAIQVDINSLENSVASALEDQIDHMRMVARRAILEAEALVEEYSATGGILQGGTGDFSSNLATGGDITSKIKIAERLQNEGTFRRIMMIAGRFQNIAIATQQTRIDKPQSVVGLAYGNDLERIVPSELVYLGQPGLEIEFFRKYAERQLLQYQKSGDEPLGEGSIIGLIDSSGSMKDAFRGQTKEIWAKAALLGLLAVAKHQNRHMAIVHFSSSNQLQIYKFNPQDSPQAMQSIMIDCLELFFNGGTDLEQAMKEALKIIDEDQFDDADVICLTDGITNISAGMQEEWTKIRKQREMKCYSILIGSRIGANTLERISDEVLHLDPYQDDTLILKTIFTI